MSNQDPPLRQRRATSHPSEDGDHQRQKRRRVDVDECVAPAGTSQPSTILTQISTWEIPPDVQPAEKSPPIELSDSDDLSPKTAPSRVPASSAAPSVSTPEPLSAYTCPICFSPPTNATLTPCGHICCGACLFTAVKSTIRRNMAIAMDRAPPPRWFRCFQFVFPTHPS